MDNGDTTRRVKGERCLCAPDLPLLAQRQATVIEKIKSDIALSSSVCFEIMI